jgi:hypothetical protein
MAYALRKDLWFCQIEGQTILLDEQLDQYVLLQGDLGNALLTQLSGRPVAHPQLQKLTALGFLVESSDQTRLRLQPHVMPTRISARDLPHPTGRLVSLMVALEAFFLVLASRRSLRRESLKKIISEAADYRRRHVKFRAASSMPLELVTLQAVSQFERARRYVPFEPSCLVDSLSLMRFLARRGLPSRIVIGVSLHPFSAHCWVQCGDLALNESLVTACAYTQIRII